MSEHTAKSRMNQIRELLQWRSMTSDEIAQHLGLGIKVTRAYIGQMRKEPNREVRIASFDRRGPTTFVPRYALGSEPDAVRQSAANDVTAAPCGLAWGFPAMAHFYGRAA